MPPTRSAKSRRAAASPGGRASRPSTPPAEDGAGVPVARAERVPRTPQPAPHPAPGPRPGSPPAPEAVREPVIVSVGDVSFDWLWFFLPRGAGAAREGAPARQRRGGAAPEDGCRSWHARQQVEQVAVHGGAWSLDNFVRMLLGPDCGQRVFTYRRFPQYLLRASDPQFILHSDIEYHLKIAETTRAHGGRGHPGEGATQVYRVNGFPRYSGPGASPGGSHRLTLAGCAQGALRKAQDEEREKLKAGGGWRDDTNWLGEAFRVHLTVPHPYPADVPRIVAIHDENNGFRSNPDNWRHILPLQEADPRANELVRGVVLNLNPAAGVAATEEARQNKLWNHLEKGGYLDRTTVVLDADDLRDSGVQISRSVSWERTAYDFVSQLPVQPVLKRLTKAAHLVVRFGLSGIIHHARSESGTNRFLYYDPERIEGEYRSFPDEEGNMFGFNTILTATVASSFITELWNELNAAPDKEDRRKVDRIVYREALHRAVESSLKPGLVSCRNYFRTGFGRSAADHRVNFEAWDRLDRLGREDLVDDRQAHELLTESAVYPTPRIPRADTFGPPATLVVEVRYELHVAENPTGQSLLYPQKVIEENAEQMRRFLVGLGKKALPDPAHALHVGVQVKPYAERRGKALLVVSFGLQRPPKGATARAKVLSEALERHVPERIRDDLVKAVKSATRQYATAKGRRPKKSTADADKRFYIGLVKEMAKAVVDLAFVQVCPEIRWRYGWPLCVSGFSGDGESIAKVGIENDENWVILNPRLQNLQKIAMTIVQRGLAEALRGRQGAAGDSAPDPANPDGRFPCARFGGLTTVDRKEIESYRSIRNLIAEYLAKKADPGYKPVPLSLAVFGPPGSGKSFGVREIAKSVSTGRGRVEEYEYNLSQFTSPRDLSNALLKARDKALEGADPLVFFDEFDADYDHQPLGWLKYFLSVMQDGMFRSDAGELRVGRAIFVFAGGTSRSYRQFARKERGTSADEERDREAFRLAKGPDFVSRLRGFVDIIGPDPRPDTNDEVFVIRRAITLRGLLERKYKHLDPRGPLDEDVAHAMLNVSGYEHGTRSLEAILDMSTLAGARRFEKSALPSREQLEMHLARNPLKPNEFFDLLRRDRRTVVV